MGKTAGCDAGIDPLISTELSVVLTPVALIRHHYIRQSVRCGSDALQHRLQLLGVQRLVNYSQCHDNLVITVDGQTAAVALDVVAI